MLSSVKMLSVAIKVLKSAAIVVSNAENSSCCPHLADVDTSQDLSSKVHKNKSKLSALKASQLQTVSQSTIVKCD